jgi:hypothetical protein
MPMYFHSVVASSRTLVGTADQKKPVCLDPEGKLHVCEPYSPPSRWTRFKAALGQHSAPRPTGGDTQCRTTGAGLRAQSRNAQRYGGVSQRVPPQQELARILKDYRSEPGKGPREPAPEVADGYLNALETAADQAANRQKIQRERPVRSSLSVPSTSSASTGIAPAAPDEIRIVMALCAGQGSVHIFSDHAVKLGWSMLSAVCQELRTRHPSLSDEQLRGAVHRVAERGLDKLSLQELTDAITSELAPDNRTFARE